MSEQDSAPTPAIGYGQPDEPPCSEATGNLRELLGRTGSMPEAESGHGVDRKA